MIVIRGGAIIDGTGKDPIEDSEIVIEGNQITKIERHGSSELASNDRLIDATGFTVMPGLIDAHVHLIGGRSADPAKRLLEPPKLRTIRTVVDVKTLLEWGFTAVRDLGSSDGIYLKRAIDEGTIIGPRIMSAHKMLSQTAGHGDFHSVPESWLNDIDNFSIIVDGPDECRKATRSLARIGADCIKICTTGGGGSERDGPHQPQFTLEEIRAVTEEAHRVGKFVASHAQGLQGIKNALAGGVDTIEHGTYIDDETCEEMVRLNRILVPTIINVKLYVEQGGKYGMPEYALRKANISIQHKWKAIARASKIGVKIALGSDTSGTPPATHGVNARSLEIYVKECGMKPMEAILSATKNAACALNLEQSIGTIEQGKLADIILVKGDPLKDISLLSKQENIRMVIKDGQLAVARGL